MNNDPTPERDNHRTSAGRSGENPDDEFERLLEDCNSAMSQARMDEAEALAAKLLEVASLRAEANPTPDLLLMLEADRCEELADWHGAEEALRKALTLEEAAQDDARQCHTHQKLGAFYALVGREELAFKEAQAATAAARRADLSPLLFMALEAQAMCALRNKDVEVAFACISESLEKLPGEGVYDLQRARAWVVRARCFVERGDAEAAESDLAEAWKFLAPRAGGLFLAGVQSSLASWWEVTAAIRSLRGDLSGAATGWEEAVARRRHVAAAPQLGGSSKHNALARTLHGLARCLRKFGNVDAGTEALAESQAIRTQLGLPPLEES